MAEEYKAVTVDEIIAYENGEMSEEETVVFFQKLIDTGLAWRLQGHYGRNAEAFIKAGLCHPKSESTHHD